MTDEQIREASEEEFRSHARSLSYIAITDFPHLIEWDIRLRDFQKAFEAGANYTNEKCQEEINRLKEDLKWALSHWTNGGPLRQTDDKSKLKIKEIKQRHNLGASK